MKEVMKNGRRKEEAEEDVVSCGKVFQSSSVKIENVRNKCLPLPFLFVFPFYLLFFANNQSIYNIFYNVLNYNEKHRCV